MTATVWAVVVVTALAAALPAVAERIVLRRLAGDRRPAPVQRHARRAALWLLSLGHTAAAQLAVVAAALVGLDWAGPATGDRLRTALVVTAVLVAVGGIAGAVGRPRPWVIGAGVVAALAQEVLLRGVLLTALVEVGAGHVVAVGLAAVVFAATRLPRGRAAVVGALPAGLLLGTLAAVTGSVLPAAALHAVGLVALAALDRRLGRTASAAAATPGVGCGSHDPDSPACLACPLAPLHGAAVTV